jgi:hypothetical protein
MKHNDVRRLRGVDGAWLRLKLWLHPAPRGRRSAITNLSHLSDHERRDIGLDEEVRYVDWRALRANGWR